MRGVEIRYEFREIALIVRLAHEAADWMHLAGPAAAAGYRHGADVAARHADSRGAFPELAEIQLQRTVAVLRAQRADPVANPCCQNAEVRLGDRVAVRFQLG